MEAPLTIDFRQFYKRLFGHRWCRGPLLWQAGLLLLLLLRLYEHVHALTLARAWAVQQPPYCGARVRRKKRALATYLELTFTLRINRTSENLNIGNTPAGALEQSLKTQGLTDANFFIISHSIQNTWSCPLGQVLNNATNSCVKCPVGTYYDGPSLTCKQCERGTFGDAEAQTSCRQCPAGQLTSGTGAVSQSECYVVCGRGWYYKASQLDCVLCPKGFYQTDFGQDRCFACPNGLTTAQPGATDPQQCTDACKAGHELNASDDCAPCPVGTYKDVNMAACEVCPYGYTTRTTGSSSVFDCNVVQCPAGSYHVTAASCLLCPVGSYQPAKGQDGCTACDRGRTTRLQGAVLATQCLPVSQVPCASHDCHVTGGECIVTGSRYVCRCLTGWTGDGRTCVIIDGGERSGDTALTSIIAPVVSALLVLIVITVAVLCRKKRRKQQRRGDSIGPESGRFQNVFVNDSTTPRKFSHPKYISTVYNSPHVDYMQPRLYPNFNS